MILLIKTKNMLDMLNNIENLASKHGHKRVILLRDYHENVDMRKRLPYNLNILEKHMQPRLKTDRIIHIQNLESADP